jgi:hypothetical protein
MSLSFPIVRARTPSAASHFARICLLVSFLGLCLAGCGGSASPGPSGPDAGGIRGIEAAGTDATALDAGWTRIAGENEAFTVTGTQTVRYGSGSSWITMTVSGSGNCSNAFFGSDPDFGVVKECDVAGAWTRIAGEGESFTVAGTQTVRYGSGSSWITKTVTGSGECSNAWFGSDPLFGTVKECDVAGTPSAGSWTRIAGEGESFAVSGTQTVRYGSGSAWITKSVTGSGQCTNAWFGSDPDFGVVKECDVAGSTPVAQVCTPPIGALDTSSTAPSVGDGTPGSCTEAALRTALASNDVIRFACGAAPVTIPIAAQIDLPTDRNVVIDGGGLVTLDGGGSTRLFSLIHLDYRRNGYGVTLQHLTLANGQAPGSGWVAQDPNHPQCAWGYTDGSGGAIDVRDATLHVVDVEFRNNAAASPGPDVGGGAIHVMGSLDATIVASRFVGNSASNNGAISLLQTNGRIVNSAFTGNHATGSGMNSVDTSCASGQSGAGGNSGAIGIDGSDDTDQLICGTTFVDNHANELGGAFGRTANVSPRHTTIDRSVFDSNGARQAGAIFVSNSSPLDILASTFTRNQAVGFGAAQIEGGRLNLVNSTFEGNVATQGVGGALMVDGVDASSAITNATFANNRASAGSGYFSAAIFGQLDFPVNNTVFSNNLTNDGGSPMQCTFTPTTGGGDLQWPANHVLGGAPDTPCVQGIGFADPQLGALTDNGGPTPTLLPAPSSPLRGLGRNCPATDQRGQARNAAGCTAGAVE